MVSQRGASIVVDDAQVRQLLEQIASRGAHLKPALSAVGALVRESIRTNFAQGGRPTPWKAVKNRDGQPLRDTGRLMNSMTRKVAEDEVRVGTNVVYAAVHHFGAKRGSFGAKEVMVKPHMRAIRQAFGRELPQVRHALIREHKRRMPLPWGDIPARPFMMVQDEDLIDIQEILTGYITEGKL